MFYSQQQQQQQQLEPIYKRSNKSKSYHDVGCFPCMNSVVQRAAENNFSLISEKDALSLKLIIKGK
jgi:hypothetical protein